MEYVIGARAIVMPICKPSVRRPQASSSVICKPSVRRPTWARAPRHRCECECEPVRERERDPRWPEAVNVNVRGTRDGQKGAATGAPRHRPISHLCLTPMIAASRAHRVHSSDSAFGCVARLARHVELASCVPAARAFPNPARPRAMKALCDGSILRA